MTSSTTSPDERKLHSLLKKIAAGLAVALFWLAVWQVAYRYVAQEVLLASPAQAVLRLFELAQGRLFWESVTLSCLRVLAAFLFALAVGSLLAALCARSRILRQLTGPLMGVIRATPVASFIILALVWMKTGSVPVFSAFLMVTPMIWGNMSVGIAHVDRNLLEMAKVFRMERGKVLRYIYLPAILPHFVSACSAGLGFAWKSSVAAEVIARPGIAVGRQLYNAKIYLETADLFAWTMAIILISILIEKLAMGLVAAMSRKLGGAAGTVGGGGHIADS